MTLVLSFVWSEIPREHIRTGQRATISTSAFVTQHEGNSIHMGNSSFLPVAGRAAFIIDTGGTTTRPPRSRRGTAGKQDDFNIKMIQRFQKPPRWDDPSTGYPS